MRKRGAFTLIEILVVVAIIALLLAILLPSLSRAKAIGRKGVCGAHLHGLIAAVQMYVQDSKGWTHKSPNHGLWDNAWQKPAVLKTYGPNDSNAYWGIAYHRYSKNKEIFACPAAIRVDDWPENNWGLPYQEYFKYCSYGLNGIIANAHGDKARSRPRQGMLLDSDFKRPATTIAFQDHIEQRMETPLDEASDMFCYSRGSGKNLTQWRTEPRRTWFPDAVDECFRHVGKSNTVWLDGHVSDIPKTEGKGVPLEWYSGGREIPYTSD